MKELFTLVLLAALTVPVTAQTSELWGVKGERWNPRSRLPDFSFAGYPREKRHYQTLPAA